MIEKNRENIFSILINREMNSSQAWLIYILVVVIIYLLLTLADNTVHISSLSRLLIAFIVGALIILIIAPGITSTTPDDRIWYSLLILVAFLVPIILFLWMLWTQRFNVGAWGEYLSPARSSENVEETQVCDAAGKNCRTTRIVETKNGRRVTKTLE